MRQQTTAATVAATTTTATEKIDPLMRIQEEIKEVVRREQEYRQLSSAISPTSLEEYDQQHNGNDDDNNNNDNDDSCNSLSISPVPTLQAAVTTPTTDATTATQSAATASTTSPTTTLEHASVVVATLTVTDDNSSSNTPSLALSVNSKESLDEHHHSDDSGISASSSPVNGTSANGNHKSSNSNNDAVKTLGSIKEQRYIGPNCYNMTPEPPQQKLMTRTVSTPHLAAATSKSRQFTFNPAHKGVMQRFIASRGKLQLNNNNNNNINNNYTSIGTNASNTNTIMLNSKSAATLLLATNALSPSSNGNSSSIALTAPILNGTGGMMGMAPDFGMRMIPTVTMTPAVIERDADGRPIRPGYIPVEVKIQRELKDLKSRESELKKIRKIRQSTPDLLDSIDNENVETDDDDDSEVEHCYGPGKLRSAKSIGELCDTNLSMSPRATPSPDMEYRINRNGSGAGGIYGNVGNGMRPAMSLAQLCDLDPEEAPSSHRLIAQWESLIQQNA